MLEIGRRQVVRRFLVGIVVCAIAASCRPINQTTERNTPTVTLTVSAAASLQAVLEAIDPQFHAAHPEIAIDYNFGSSGSLQQQIEQGAPVDVFFSAAAKQMDALESEGLLVSSSRQNLLANRLVLIAPQESTLEITDLQQLRTTPIERLAVGEFRSVPAGQYAEQVFATLNLQESLQAKFVFGNNVRSVLAVVESGNADLGVVYATDAALSQKMKVLLKVPEEFHQPIVYPIAILERSPHPEAARTLTEFLQQEAAQATFQDFGFDRP